MLLVHLCIKFIASHLDACPRAALEQLPVELRAAVLGHLLRSMKLGEVDFSALVGKEGQTPVIEALDLSASPYEEAGGPTAQLLRHIGACAPLLKDLRLKNCKVLNDALVQVLLEALPHLEALHLSGAMNVTDKALLNIKDKVGSQLKRLELNTPNKITAPALNQLLISTPNLRSLSINSAAALRDEIIGVVADDCRELLNLEIKNDPRLTDKATEYIARGTDGQGGLHKLKSLTLGCYHLTGAHLDVLAASCTQLERLAFPNACFKEPSTLMSICRLSSLRQFNAFSSWCLLTRDQLQALLQGCPRLEALSVCIDACSEGVFQTFRDVASGLCELVMAAHAKPASVMGSTIQFEDAKCIVEGCPRLQKLKLYNVDIEVLPLALRDLPDLQGLDLSFVEDHLAEEESAAELIEAEREALEARRSIRKEHATGSVPIASSSLRRLHLTDLPTHDVLTAEAMANIARSSPKLEVLKLALASIDTDPVLFALSAARPALRKVQLFGCANATDRGVVALIRSSGHKITGLDLRELPGIGDESLVAIFRHCGHLRSLFLAQRSQATVPTIARLQKEHPHVNVYHF